MGKLIHADCVDFLKYLDDKSFDIAIVDPPYGINAPNMKMGSNPNRKGIDNRGELQYGGVSTAEKLKKGRLNSGAGKLKDRTLNTMNCEWDNKKPSAEYFKQLFRVSKNQIIWGGNYFGLPPCRCFIVWNKEQPWENFSQAEYAWTSYDRPSKVFTHSNRGGANQENKIHPTQKPVELYTYLLGRFAVFGDTILDTHSGSGSLAVACIKTGYDFLAIEKNREYYESSKKRIEAAMRQTNLEFHE